MTDQPTKREPILCLHCREVVVTVTFYGSGGTQWVHRDGFRQCRPTYASPNLMPQWDAHAARKKAETNANQD